MNKRETEEPRTAPGRGKITLMLPDSKLMESVEDSCPLGQSRLLLPQAPRAHNPGAAGKEQALAALGFAAPARTFSTSQAVGLPPPLPSNICRRFPEGRDQWWPEWQVRGPLLEDWRDQGSSPHLTGAPHPTMVSMKLL